MKSPVTILLAACVTTVSFVGWRVHAMKSVTPNHFGQLQDPSRSYLGGCSAMLGSAEAVLNDPGVSEKSTLSVLVLGDDTTAREPRRIAEYAIPTGRKVIEGQRAIVERRTSLLQDLGTRCESVRTTSVSPIFLGVTQAIAGLRAQGCKEGSQCGLWVSTDLEENASRAIRAEIDRVGHREPLPEPLNNGGIKVTFCGYAQTAARFVDSSGREVPSGVSRDPRRDDRLQAVWRSLFTVPELVSFEPYCPASSLLPAETPTGRVREGAGPQPRLRGER